MKSRLSFFAWMLGVVVLGGALTAVHTLPLEVSRPPAEALPTSTQWSTVHVLSTRCGCSKRVLQHLVARGALAGVSERVALVESTDEWRSELEGAGFAVEATDAEALASRFGVNAAPTLIIRTPGGELAYSGAYASKRGAPPLDVELLERVRNGERPAAFPLFGCAVSRELQERSDPLSLKYGVLSK